MRYLILALALLTLAAPAAAGPPPLAASIAYAGPRAARVSAILPPGAVELCASVAGAYACRAALPGQAVAVVVAAAPGEAVAAWTLDRPYVVGGVARVIGYADLMAPGFVVYAPGVMR